MKNNNSYEIATAILETFAKAREIKTASNSGSDEFDREVRKYLQNKIKWEDLSPLELKNIGDFGACFYNTSTQREFQKFIIELKKFDNEFIGPMIKNKVWNDHEKVLCSFIDWSKLSTEEAYNFCDKVNSLPLWSAALEKVSFTEMQYYEIGLYSAGYFSTKIIGILKERATAAA